MLERMCSLVNVFRISSANARSCSSKGTGPIRLRFSYNASSSAEFGNTLEQALSTSTWSSVSVISAAPWAILRTRSNKLCACEFSGARIR